MKKKTFKKAGAAVLSMAMLVSMGAMALPVSAAEGDALTVKVESAVDLSGIKVYQVAKLDSATGQWSWNAPFNTVIDDSVTFDSLKTLDATQTNTLAKILKYATKFTANADDLAKTLVSQTNNTKIADPNVQGGVQVAGKGYYLIIPESGNNDNVFQPSLVEIDSTGTEITELHAKANPLPLDKIITATTPGQVSDSGNTSVGVIGSTVEYEITSMLPDYYETVTADKVKSYVLTDDPSEGITINNTDFTATGSNVKVYFDDVETDLYTVAAEGDGFKITVTGANVLANQGKTVKVTFKATVDTDAVLGDAKCADADTAHQEFTGNPNTVTLNWGNNYATGGYLDPTNPDNPFEPENPDNPPEKYDPKNPPEGTEYPNPPEKKDTVTTYVGKIILEKYGDNVNGLISGAEFKLEGVNHDFTKNYTVENGTFDFGYLPAGTYTLTETKAPRGYKTISSTYEFTVTNGAAAAGDEFTTFVVAENAQVDRVEMVDIQTADDKASAMSKVKITVTDPVADTLPATGGIGTVIFTVGGAAIILLAGVFFVIYMKKRRVED